MYNLYLVHLQSILYIYFIYKYISEFLINLVLLHLIIKYVKYTLLIFIIINESNNNKCQ